MACLTLYWVVMCVLHLLCCRLTVPWGELESFAANFNLDKVDDIIHKHTPYGNSHKHIP
jgi:hypothetical protein